MDKKAFRKMTPPNGTGMVKFPETPFELSRYRKIASVTGHLLLTQIGLWGWFPLAIRLTSNEPVAFLNDRTGRIRKLIQRAEFGRALAS